MFKPRCRDSLHCWISCIKDQDADLVKDENGDLVEEENGDPVKDCDLVACVTMFDADGKESVAYRGKVSFQLMKT